jgi:acetyl esterase/lipase
MLPEPSGPPLILPVEPVALQSSEDLDVYLPAAGPPAPCVLLVHGLYPERPDVTPRQSRFYRDYASHLARRGIAAAVVDHDLMDGFLYPEALTTVSKALDQLRSLPTVDGDAVGVWFFSGGGPLAYPFLAAPPSWLRCVELTYPVLPGPGTPGWPTPEQAIAGIATVPTFLTLVEHEIPDFVDGQNTFVAQASKVGASFEIQRVDGVGHGFDAMTDSPRAREAVAAGLNWMVERLTSTQR